MKETKNNKKGIIIVIIAIVVIVAIALGGYFLSNSNNNNDNDAVNNVGKGDKTISVQVEYSDEDIRVYNINTSAEYLREALEEQNLIEGEEHDYGYYLTTVGGVEVDLSINQWWCLYVGEEMLKTGIDKTPIKDGDSYRLKLIG